MSRISRSHAQHYLQVEDIAVVGRPVDFYVFVNLAPSAWIKGQKHEHDRLTHAYQDRQWEEFKALANRLAKENPRGPA